MKDITLNSYLDVLQINESYFQEANSFSKDKIDIAIKSYKKNIAVAEKILKDNGVNISEIKSKAKLIAKSFEKEIKLGYKNNIPPLKIGEKISKKVGIEIKKSIKSIKKSITTDIGNSIVLLIGLIFISMIAVALVAPIFFLLGIPKATMIFSVLIAAPLLEEFFKRMAIFEGYPWIYTGIFAGFEFFQYVIVAAIGGLSMGPFIIMRLAGVIMHFMSTTIQKYYYDKSKNDNESPEQEVFNKKGINGYYLAVLLHFTWNLMALLGQDTFKSLLG